LEFSKQKSPRQISPPQALHDFRDDDNLPVICPTCQMFFATVNRLRKTHRAGTINLA